MKLYIHKQKNFSKPTTDTIKYIASDILNYPVDVNIQDFAVEHCFRGRTVCLANFKQKKLAKATPIISQELVMLDFDNTDEHNLYQIADLEKDQFMLDNAVFYYTTFSDKDSYYDRFRVVFRLDSLVKSTRAVETIYKELFKRYPMADKTVGQTSRLFFGTTNGYKPINWDNTLKISDISKYELLEKDNSFELIDDTTPIYRLLQLNKYTLAEEKFKNKYGNKFNNIFSDDYSAIVYYSNIDMVELLELPQGNPFLDIFHEESNPSASVFYDEDTETYVYKCFSESHPYTGDIIKVILSLTGIPSRIKGIELLLKMTGGELDFSSKLGISNREANEFRRTLLSGKYKTNYPELFGYLDKYKLEIAHTLDIMFDFVYEDKGTGELRYLNYYSFETLRKKVSYSTNKKISAQKMWNILNIIIVTELIQKLPLKSIPNDIYENLIEVQREDRNQIRHSNVYEPNVLSGEHLKGVGEIAKLLKENDVTVTSLSFEIIYRLFGEEKAKKDFPQAYTPLQEKGLVRMSKQDSNLTRKQTTFEKLVISLIMTDIESKGYIFEDDLIKKISRKRKTSIASCKTTYTKVRADICNKYSLDRKRLSKDLHKTLKVTEEYRNKTIIFKS